MESILFPISELNDFVFCPKSIYLHHCLGRIDKRLYQSEEQAEGTEVHRSVDEKRYSTRKRYITSLRVTSTVLGVTGKIDIYDQQTQTLIERKTRVQKLYKGLLYQIWAQYYALSEMGYEVKKLKIHSVRDNRPYEIPLPSMMDFRELQMIVDRMRAWRPTDDFEQNPVKCSKCVYRSLCDTGMRNEARSSVAVTPQKKRSKSLLL